MEHAEMVRRLKELRVYSLGYTGPLPYEHYCIQALDQAIELLEKKACEAWREVYEVS